ncbi:uncharacterized protein LOC133308424 isoform X2 [Gastrolobium bilobum]|uniref:uncharacterized protein LOC133308424 isoform X2 n=1 Tax=Gastrolobium bilobum TaxID=150636 RepID=UPI002AB145A0|nr:uncharacterized protein LOC133308424 isoform X2 [Gastrolobium bilobum]
MLELIKNSLSVWRMRFLIILGNHPTLILPRRMKSYFPDPAEEHWFTWFLPSITCIQIMTSVKAHQFFTEESWDSFKQIFDTYMFEASKEWVETVGGVSLLDALFKALDEVVKLVDCEIYGYVPDSEADPLLERGAIWSFNFLFYNRKLKRIVTFRFSCFSNWITDGFLIDEIHDEDEEIFADMDI